MRAISTALGALNDDPGVPERAGTVRHPGGLETEDADPAAANERRQATPSMSAVNNLGGPGLAAALHRCALVRYISAVPCPAM